MAATRGTASSSMLPRIKYSRYVLVQRVILWLMLIFLLLVNKPARKSIGAFQKSSMRGPSLSREARSNHLACVKDSLQYLPLGRGYRKRSRNPLNLAMMYSNHFDASTGFWNGDDRLVNLTVPSNSDCTVWEVGAFKNARDSQDMMPKYPHCKFHAFEPVPAFYQELEKRFQDNPRMDTHNYGLGKEAFTFRLDPSTLRDEGTFLKNSAQGSIEAKIESFEYATRDCGGKSPSVLQMNCEGCEWILIPQLIESGFIDRVPIVQIATHNYPIRDNETESVGRRVWQLCEMRGMLNATHEMTMGMPFAWERWELRK